MYGCLSTYLHISLSVRVCVYACLKFCLQVSEHGFRLHHLTRDWSIASDVINLFTTGSLHHFELVRSRDVCRVERVNYIVIVIHTIGIVAQLELNKMASILL